MRATVCRKERFNSAHRLFVDSWSNDENNKVFGKCNKKFVSILRCIEKRIEEKTDYYKLEYLLERETIRKTIKPFNTSTLNNTKLLESQEADFAHFYSKMNDLTNNKKATMYNWKCTKYTDDRNQVKK